MSRSGLSASPARSDAACNVVNQRAARLKDHRGLPAAAREPEKPFTGGNRTHVCFGEPNPLQLGPPWCDRRCPSDVDLLKY